MPNCSSCKINYGARGLFCSNYPSTIYESRCLTRLTFVCSISIKKPLRIYHAQKKKKQSKHAQDSRDLILEECYELFVSQRFSLTLTFLLNEINMALTLYRNESHLK